MTRGFSTIMAAQFFSSLADNALFVIAVELLLLRGAAEWQRVALVPLFAFFYVVLAPWVGAFADAQPKGRVMFISNAIKVAGCLLMLAGHHPLLAYSVVGLGAAAYSPAKYGILTELLPLRLLVKANGWMEGLTIASIILGVLLGGLLVSPSVADWLQAVNAPVSAPIAAIAAMAMVYMVAAAFNLRIPRTQARLRRLPRRAMWLLLPDFWRCNQRLWTDRLGQISLASTTLLWGISGNMRYVVLAWAAVALSYTTAQGSVLVGVVALGTAIGAVLVSIRIPLQHAPRVMPLGVVMGLLLVAMTRVDQLWLAAPLLLLLGILGGYLIVPMNALLQHRGHIRVGAGRSIAVQNFNEQSCILILGLLYAGAAAAGLGARAAIVLFGLLAMVGMASIHVWHRHNLQRYPQELQDLLRTAGQTQA